LVELKIKKLTKTQLITILNLKPGIVKLKKLITEQITILNLKN